MPFQDDTKIGGNKRHFPNTSWSKLEAIKEDGILTAEYKSILDLLINNYWKPVYVYLRRRGFGNEEAKDIVQEFFTYWVKKGLFGRADSSKGKFRTYMISSLNNFVSNIKRAEYAQKRRPEGGFLNIDDSKSDDEVPFEPVKSETPESIFHRTWFTGLISRVIQKMQVKCESTGKEEHLHIFVKRIIQPSLEGLQPPPLKALAEKFNITEKQATNHLTTAKRIFKRLLEKEIRIYATSENEINEEIGDLFKLIGEA